MEMHSDEYFTIDAVRDLQALGLNVEGRHYGFHLSHNDSAGAYSGACGSEHDWSVSFALTVNKPPCRWFFRFDVREMVALITTAYVNFREGRSISLAAALEEADGHYDHAALTQRLQALRRSHGFD